MNPFSGTHRRPRGIRSSNRAGGIDDVARHAILYSSGVGPRPACHRTGRLPRIMSALLLILLVNRASALAQ
jgi:hypothetical protein